VNKKLKAFLRNEEGLTIVEYAVAAGLITAAVGWRDQSRNRVHLGSPGILCSAGPISGLAGSRFRLE
jgi:hypothetical protein